MLCCVCCRAPRGPRSSGLEYCRPVFSSLLQDALLSAPEAHGGDKAVVYRLPKALALPYNRQHTCHRETALLWSSRNLFGEDMGAEEISQELRALAGPTEDQIPVPDTYICQLTTAGNPSSRASDTLSWPLRVPAHTCAYTHSSAGTHTQREVH